MAPKSRSAQTGGSGGGCAGGEGGKDGGSGGKLGGGGDGGEKITGGAEGGGYSVRPPRIPPCTQPQHITVAMKSSSSYVPQSAGWSMYQLHPVPSDPMKSPSPSVLTHGGGSGGGGNDGAAGGELGEGEGGGVFGGGG